MLIKSIQISLHELLVLLMICLFLVVQLTAVNTLVFSVLAVDADGDTIIYSIDQSSVRHEHVLTRNP